jgi:hypothetical protein
LAGPRPRNDKGSDDGKSKSNALGWDDQTIAEDMEAWNDEILEALAGTYVLNENDD